IIKNIITNWTKSKKKEYQATSSPSFIPFLRHEQKENRDFFRVQGRRTDGEEVTAQRSTNHHKDNIKLLSSMFVHPHFFVLITVNIIIITTGVLEAGYVQAFGKGISV
ncbi:hypothetical protein LINPERHAP1_LOCUS4768, partial [Linum perenne]